MFVSLTKPHCSKLLLLTGENDAIFRTVKQLEQQSHDGYLPARRVCSAEMFAVVNDRSSEHAKRSRIIINRDWFEFKDGALGKAYESVFRISRSSKKQSQFSSSMSDRKKRFIQKPVIRILIRFFSLLRLRFGCSIARMKPLEVVSFSAVTLKLKINSLWCNVLLCLGFILLPSRLWNEICVFVSVQSLGLMNDCFSARTNW